jgi:hypothetical protein
LHGPGAEILPRQMKKIEEILLRPLSSAPVPEALRGFGVVCKTKERRPCCRKPIPCHDAIFTRNPERPEKKCRHAALSVPEREKDKTLGSEANSSCWRLQHAAKGGAGPQIAHQVLDAAEVAAQEVLLLLGGQGACALAAAPGPGGDVGGVAGVAGAEGARELAGAALQHGGDGGAGVGAGDGGDLGHEVEVEELDELELDLARGGAGLEEGGDGEEAVEGLEGAGVGGGVDEGGDEDEEGCRLDGGAVDGLEEVEEELEVCVSWGQGLGERVRDDSRSCTALARRGSCWAGGGGGRPEWCRAH